MKPCVRGAIGVACALSVGVGASAQVVSPLVGGAFVTQQAWNDAATATLGEQATVYRLFATLRYPESALAAVLEPRIEIAGGRFYDDPFGTALPHTQSLESLVPSLQWDTFVAMGRLHQPSFVSLIGEGVGVGAQVITAPTADPGGWGTQDSMNEGRGVAPGGADLNGEPIIPADFDPAYRYVFLGQFTVLGHEADLGRSPILDGGFIDGAGLFSGQMLLIGRDGLSERRQIVPAPGAGALVGVGALARRRRR